MSEPLRIRFRVRWSDQTQDVRQALSQRGGRRAMQLGQRILAVAQSLIRPARIERTARGARRWIPSAPGQPPRSRTGTLRTSIDIGYLAPTARIGARVIVGPRARYGRFLEYGTYKMAARPFMRPAVERVRKSGRLLAAWRALW